MPEENLSDTIKYDKIARDFATNVDAKDRWYHLTLYKNCFVGRDAVDYLVHCGRASSRREAVEIGRYLQTQRKLFGHVTGDHPFQDALLFYCYNSISPEHNDASFDRTLDSSRRSDAEDPPEGAETLRHYVERTAGRRPSVSLNKISEMIAQKISRKSPEETSETSEETYDSISVAEDAHVPKTKINDPFTTEIKPEAMRCLALVAHNHMKPAMKKFIEEHSEVLKKFRLTGTNTTITMSKSVFGESNPEVEYGPTFTSGPLGGDAQLAALMCYEDLGGIIFFVDPLSPHPHQADIDSLIRLANVNNVILCLNPTSATSTMWMIRHALGSNNAEMMPSFFETLESPCVPEYKAAQKSALHKAVNS